MNYTYQVVDNRTGQVISTHTSHKLARRKADRLDLEYGAIRYSVVTVTGTGKPEQGEENQ